MSLLPTTKTGRKYADGGKLTLGYESQLGATLGADGVGAAVGDSLYKNIPPLAVPFVHVAPANLDNIRAEAAAEGKEKADKLQEEVRKMLAAQLKDAKMGAAQREDLSQRGQHFLGEMESALRTDPAMFANPANRVAVFNQLERELSAGRIASGVNGYTNSQKYSEQFNRDNSGGYAAYTRDGKRLNLSRKEATDAFETNTSAEHLGRLGIMQVKKGSSGFYDFGEFNLANPNGTEQEAIKNFQSVINTLPTSTNGSEQAGVDVQTIQGSQGEKYTVGSSSSNVSTSNAAHVNGLLAKLVGYKGKDKKYHAGDWRQLVATEADRYGLLEPRLTKYDNQPLQKGEQVSIEVAGQNGQVQQVQLIGGEASQSRRQLLQYLEANPSAANQKALRQLEQNRQQLADRDITSVLATQLGAKLVTGTVHHESVSASRIPVPAAEKKAGELPSNLYPALNAGSPAFSKDAESGTYPIIGKDGKPVTVSSTDKNGKAVQTPVQISPAVTVIKGIEGVQDWANSYIWKYGKPGTAGDNTERLTLGDLPKQMAVYHVTPQGLRQVQGGNQVGQLPGGRNFKIVGQNNTITWLPADPHRGMEQYQAQIQEATQASQRIGQQLEAGQISRQVYGQQMASLRQQAQAAGLMPYLSVSVAATENTLNEASKPGNGQNSDTYVGSFGYHDSKTGKAKRPDQRLGVVYSDNDDLAREHGWEKLSGDDAKQYGINPNAGWTQGQFNNTYVTKMLVPATNLQFNSSSKVVNENVKQAEQDAQQEKAVEVGNSYLSGSWGQQ